jgi:hypothetical protein
MVNTADKGLRRYEGNIARNFVGPVGDRSRKETAGSGKATPAGPGKLEEGGRVAAGEVEDAGLARDEVRAERFVKEEARGFRDRKKVPDLAACGHGKILTGQSGSAELRPEILGVLAFAVSREEAGVGKFEGTGAGEGREGDGSAGFGGSVDVRRFKGGVRRDEIVTESSAAVFGIRAGDHDPIHPGSGSTADELQAVAKIGFKAGFPRGRLRGHTGGSEMDQGIVPCEVGFRQSIKAT